MFLEPTHGEDIYDIVSQFSLMKSIDHHDMNMYSIKYINGSITISLVHICNLSFDVGIFPDVMKIARVMHIYI